MAEVKGFRAYRYNADRVGRLDNVITPPWDVIDPAEQTQLRNLSPYNYVHLILPLDEPGRDRYTDAGARFNAWIDEGILERDAVPHIYLLEQIFTGLDGATYRRRGFFAACRIPEPGEKTVLGHERTFEHKVADRLRLTEATQANFGAVFVMYSDPQRTLEPLFDPIDSMSPDFSARTIDGVEQRFWMAPDDGRVTRFMTDSTLYIADGHHRFLTACTYRDRMRAEHSSSGPRPYDFVLMGFVPFHDEGLQIHAPHRLLSTPPGFSVADARARLERWFDVAPVEGPLLSVVDAAPGCAIGFMVRGEGQYLLRLRDEAARQDLLSNRNAPAYNDLDVVVLHEGILEKVLNLPPDAELDYEPNTKKALERLQTGERDILFLLKPTAPDQVRACADAGEFMPQKATYFFPKLPSGGVVYRFE